MSTRFDLPVIDDETAPWWAAARNGRLLIRRCADCGVAFLYPRPFCPTCWSEHVSWEEAAGAATLYTYSVVRTNDLPPFRERLPYVAAVVELAEGPRLMTNIVDCPMSRLRIGMPLTLCFEARGEDVVLPMFRPARRPCSAPVP